MQTLRFLAKAGDHSFSPPRVRAGQVLPIGKTRNEDGSWRVDTEPTAVTLAGDEQVGDLGFLRKEVLEGRLVAADQDTADALGTPFDVIELIAAPLLDANGAPVDVPPAPPGELAPAPAADAKHVDTLPPPPLDTPVDLGIPAPPKNALKRVEK